MKFFAIILVVSIVLLASISAPSAGRRPPTQSEQATYLPLVQMWLGQNWEQKKDLGDGVQIAQKITEVTYCCLDEDENGHVHIIDIRFHAKYYDRNWCFVATAYDVVGNESDFSNEVCADFVIKKQKPANLGIQ